GEFEAVLDYAGERLERKQALGDYVRAHARERASPTLHDEPFFLRPPYNLRRALDSRPLAVIFETVDCPPCDELHREAFQRDDVLREVGRVDVARLSLGSAAAV